LNGTHVATTNAGPFARSITVNGMSVPALSSVDSATLFFKAPSNEKPAFTTLINMHVKGWNALLTSMLTNNSQEEPGKFGHLQSQVFPR
jgi:hypothetical protein